MSKLPLKYIEKCFDALRYVDDYEVKSAHVYVCIGFTCVSHTKYINVYHYDTLIARIFPSDCNVCIFGGYSASDRDIINSFIILYGWDDLFKVRMRKSDGLYIQWFTE